MAFIFLSTLLFSIIGILSLFLLKYWELQTGKMVAGSLRPKTHRFFHTVLFWIERVIPTMVRVYSQQALQAALGFVHRAVAFLVLFTERLLERALHLIHR